MPKKYNNDVALQKLKNLCRKRELSQKQAIDKFCGFGFSYHESLSLTSDLVSGGYVNDQRYAEAYIHDKLVLDLWGKNKINQKLFEAGIPKQTTIFAWKKFEEDLYRRSLREAIEKYRDKYLISNSFEDKQRFLRFLANRGFETSLCIEELDREK